MQYWNTAECPVLSIPYRESGAAASSSLVIIDGDLRNFKNRAWRTIACAPMYNVLWDPERRANPPSNAQNITCARGNWTLITLQCQKTCPTYPIAMLCKFDMNTRNCEGMYDIEYRDTTGSVVKDMLEWERVEYGSVVRIRCDENKNYSPSDGRENRFVWVFVFYDWFLYIAIIYIIAWVQK